MIYHSIPAIQRPFSPPLQVTCYPTCHIQKKKSAATKGKQRATSVTAVFRTTWRLWSSGVTFYVNSASPEQYWKPRAAQNKQPFQETLNFALRISKEPTSSAFQATEIYWWLSRPHPAGTRAAAARLRNWKPRKLSPLSRSDGAKKSKARPGNKHDLNIEFIYDKEFIIVITKRSNAGSVFWTGRRVRTSASFWTSFGSERSFFSEPGTASRHQRGVNTVWLPIWFTSSVFVTGGGRSG